MAQSTSSTLQAEPPSEISSEKVNKHQKKQDMAHTERHSEHGDVVRDVIIGFADGLTVPFALTAGLSSFVPLHRPFLLVLNQIDSAPPNSS